MTEFFIKTKAAFVVWRLAWAKALLMSLVAGGTVLQTSLSGIDWTLLTGTEKTMLGLGVFVAMANTLVAFLDKTLSRIENAESEQK